MIVAVVVSSLVDGSMLRELPSLVAGVFTSSQAEIRSRGALDLLLRFYAEQVVKLRGRK